MWATLSKLALGYPHEEKSLINVSFGYRQLDRSGQWDLEERERVRREGDVDVLTLQLALGVAHADRVGPGKGIARIGIIPVDLVDGHYPGGLGIVEANPRRDCMVGVPIDYRYRQQAALRIARSGHVQQLELPEVGDPVGPAVGGLVLVSVSTGVGEGVERHRLAGVRH